MTYSQTDRDKVLKSLLQGKNVKEISDSNGGKPSKATIDRWIKDGIICSKPAKSDPLVKIHKTGRDEWGIKDYRTKEQQKGNKKKLEYEENWRGVEGYKPKSLTFIESAAREKYHGSSLEDELHLGVYQLQGSPRTKKVGIAKSLIKLTSQNHIFPDTRITKSDESYDPKNIREGNAVINNYISARIDPVFEGGGKAISESTAKMLNKYNLKNTALDKHITFKYFGDRIATSNMVKKLPVSAGGAFEDPEPGILDGINEPSKKAYSVPLYKINTKAGIIDTSSSVIVKKIKDQDAPISAAPAGATKKALKVMVDIIIEDDDFPSISQNNNEEAVMTTVVPVKRNCILEALEELNTVNYHDYEIVDMLGNATDQ